MFAGFLLRIFAQTSVFRVSSCLSMKAGFGTLNPQPLAPKPFTLKGFQNESSSSLNTKPKLQPEAIALLSGNEQDEFSTMSSEIKRTFTCVWLAFWVLLPLVSREWRNGVQL